MIYADAILLCISCWPRPLYMFIQGNRWVYPQSYVSISLAVYVDKTYILTYHMYAHFKNYELGLYIRNDPIQNKFSHFAAVFPYTFHRISSPQKRRCLVHKPQSWNLAYEWSLLISCTPSSYAPFLCFTFLLGMHARMYNGLCKDITRKQSQSNSALLAYLIKFLLVKHTPVWFHSNFSKVLYSLTNYKICIWNNLK